MISFPSSEEFFAGTDVEIFFDVDDGSLLHFAMGRPGLGATVSTDLGNAVASEATEENEGKISVLLAADVTAGLYGTYEYQSQAEDVLGNRIPVQHGYYTFRPSMIEAGSTS